MDNREELKDAFFPWIRPKANPSEPFIEAVFRVVEMAVLVGFIQYLAMTHKGVFLTIVAEVLQIMMGWYAGSKAAPLLPDIRWMFSPVSARADRAYRILTVILAYVGIGGGCILMMGALLEEVVASQVAERVTQQ